LAREGRSDVPGRDTVRQHHVVLDFSSPFARKIEFSMSGAIMTTNSVVRARIDDAVKKTATKVLASMGLTVSDAVRIMLTKVAKDKALPFELTPNALIRDQPIKRRPLDEAARAADGDAVSKKNQSRR
jgi:addiction module RelB/DinJ family antitoxin